jgi:hypothetical protein
MKSLAIILALAATMVAAIPASEVSKLVSREPDCATCFHKYDFCVEVSFEFKKQTQTPCIDVTAARSHPRSGRLQADLP